MKSTLTTCTFLLHLTMSLSALASEQSASIATLAQTEGKAQLFTHPSKKPFPEMSLKAGTMALFEGEYYLIQEAKLGDRFFI